MSLKQKVLIIDEAGFSRVCSSILRRDGFSTVTLEDHQDIGPKLLEKMEFGLLIISYPFGAYFIEKAQEANIPTIILTGHIDKELISLVEHNELLHYMIKPIGYEKFRSLVKDLMSENNQVWETTFNG